MANFTCKAIKQTFITLLEERPLSEITVKDIVEKCGINRNSFYYHFQDLPTLLEEIIKEEAEGFIHSYPSVSSIVECFDAMIKFASKNKKAIMHIYRSVSREAFERHLMSVSEYFVQQYMDTALKDEEISDKNKQTIVRYYKCVCFGLIIDWLNNGMQEEHAQSVRRMFLIQKDFSREVSEFLQGQI